MTGIIATMGPAIANKSKINALLKRNVVDYWVNYGLKKNSFKYIQMLCKLKDESEVPLKIYLELPSSRCRHIKQQGEIKEDQIYKLYDENTVDSSEKNCLVMGNLASIMDSLEVGEKIFYEDGLCIVSINNMEKSEKGYIMVTCDKACGASDGGIAEGSAVSFNGTDKKFEIIREKDKNFLRELKQNNLMPDFFAVSFCMNKDDVRQARNDIEEIFGSKIKFLVKIQNKSAVEKIDDVMEYADGVVIERGDLIYALEDDFRLPQVQHMILEKAKQQKKISIVSSGFMSEYSKTSIMNRAEQSDVYRLREEEGDFLLLTRETGKAPHALATVDAIQKILRG